MPAFKILRRVDAFVDFVTEVEAESAAEASKIANEDETRFVWKEDGTHQFDARSFVAVNADGSEIEGTQCGDF